MSARWIGRDSPIPRQPRSPDVIPFDFFHWGYVKDNMYTSRVMNITDLKTGVVDAVSYLNRQMLKNTWKSCLSGFIRLDPITVRALNFIRLFFFFIFALCCLLTFYLSDMTLCVAKKT